MALLEWELWACALAIERQYGDDAPRHIGERITKLALAGDEAGVETWDAIASRYDQLSPERGGKA